jgi:tRNA threonylcarbamoyladenosine biosynthesis protein TsaE
MQMEWETASAEETRAVAGDWARGLGPGSVVRLHGPLGAGKTTWVQGMAQGLGAEGEVTSPTFALLHEYPCPRFPLHHWDLYRLGPETDWSLLDLVEHLPGPGITVVEWPERYPGPWPEGVRDVWLEAPAEGEGKRIIRVR